MEYFIRTAQDSNGKIEMNKKGHAREYYHKHIPTYVQTRRQTWDAMLAMRSEEKNKHKK